MRFTYTKFGLASKPVGAQVAMPWKGRTLLGDVVGVRREFDGRVILTVRHFDGSPWPVEPVASVVDVLDRHVNETKERSNALHKLAEPNECSDLPEPSPQETEFFVRGWIASALSDGDTGAL